MNKILIPNGGMPFEGDDLLWMQEAWRMGFYGLSEFFSSGTGYNDNSCILRGVNLSIGSGNVTYSTGTVIIAGEICTLGSGIAVGAEGNLDQWWIELESFPDPAGTQPFADAVVKDTYEIRRAKVTNSAVIPSEGAMRFDLLDRYKVFNVWVPPPLLSGFSQGEQIQVVKNHRLISFKGTLLASGPTPNNATAFLLPEYLRPPYTRVYVVSSGTIYPPLYITVESGGEVKVSRVDVSDPIPFLGTIFLDAVFYTV